MRFKNLLLLSKWAQSGSKSTNFAPNLGGAIVRSLQIGNATGKTKSRSILSKVGLGLGLGFVVATGGFEAFKRFNVAPINRNERDELDVGKLKIILPDNVKASRKVSGLLDLDLSVTLYQFQSCPFCCKVRSFLEYYGIPFEEVEVHPVLKKELQFARSKKVPLMVVKYGKEQFEILTESSVIISVLASYLLNPSRGLEETMACYKEVEYQNPDGKTVKEYINMYFLMFGERYDELRKDEITEERNWRRWADSDLVHLISPNVYRTMAESKETFDKFSERGRWQEIFNVWERNLAIYAGAAVMYLIGNRLKKKYNLKDDVRESLYEASRKWMRAIGTEKKFMGGELPNLADLAVYGVLNSMEGCRAFEDMLRETTIGPWYMSVQKHIRIHSGSKLVTNINNKIMYKSH